jgi:hypothetical protein
MEYTYETHLRGSNARIDVSTRFEDAENNYCDPDNYYIKIYDNHFPKEPVEVLENLQDWQEWRDFLEKNAAWKPSKVFGKDPLPTENKDEPFELPEKGHTYFVEDDGFHELAMSMFKNAEELHNEIVKGREERTSRIMSEMKETKEGLKDCFSDVAKAVNDKLDHENPCREIHFENPMYSTKEELRNALSGYGFELYEFEDSPNHLDITSIINKIHQAGYQKGVNEAYKEGYDAGVRDSSEYVEISVDGDTHKLILSAAKVQEEILKKVPRKSAMVDKKDAINPPHYKSFLDQYQWIETMCRLQRFKDNPEQFEAAIELQVRKYLDRCGRKDARLQELEKALWYLKFLVAYVKGGSQPIHVSEVEDILSGKLSLDDELSGTLVYRSSNE